MAYTREQIQLLFQSSFDLAKWTDLIINFFNAREVRRVPVPLDIDSTEGQGYELGYLDTNDTYRIGFFYLKLNRSIDNRKVGLRQMIANYIKIDADAGIGVFDDGKHWRLSFITDLRGEKTSPKRYTFVFGDSQNMYRTAVDRFMELQRKGISFANIKDAFSVEALTKQFYNELFDWYTWALKEDTGVYFPNNPNTPADDRENLDTKMIRLITRLMFVWFIKQKGLVPDALFNPEEVDHWLKDFDAQSMESANYYQAILQNLFFATLNRPIKTVSYDKNGNEIVERRGFAHLQGKQDVKSLYRYEELFKISKDKILSIFEFIPFINGGLFECLDKNKTSDGVDHAYFEDGFSRNSTIKDGRWTKRAFVPNKLFFDPEDGIISIFNRYNFTVEENSPSEQQIALDPELLGKVFENLLGAYNPETQQTARSQSGSFYTPREIVNYMVDRSLEAYLGNTDEVKALFKDSFVYDETQREFYDGVIAKLKTIKVLDPACGSGAFPMGMLNRIVEIMQNLQAPGCKYDLKLQIMENCIYGGDIQTIAAQITKLRFFISLVCDCKKTDSADENYGIPNLPNLETHFVTCDSLIGLKKPQSYDLFELDVVALKDKLKEVRHEHFTAKTVYQKTKLRNRDKELRDELAKMLSDDNVIASEEAKMMAAWNPYDQNGKSPFFDPEWMFGIKDGFDVVIGNPPYVQLQAESGRLAKMYEKCNYKTFIKTGDIYCLFYERGNEMLRKGGVLCYITSNKWMRAGYGKKMRSYLTKYTNPTTLIDFGDTHIFESACVMTNILMFENQKNHYLLEGTQMKEDFNNPSLISDYVSEHKINCEFHDGEMWVIMPESLRKLHKKVEGKGKMLKDWDVEMYRGILTGLNPVFIISESKKEEILKGCLTETEKIKTAEIITPLLRGKDITKYGHNWANLWIINTHNGVRGKLKRVDVEELPSLKSYLNEHYKELEKRSDKGETPYNLRNCAYIEEFFKPKIIYPEITKYQPFLYDENKFMVANTAYILTGNHISYLCAFLNSSLFKFCFKESFAVLFGGARRMLKMFFDKIPVLEVDDATDAEFRKLVLDIQKEYSDEKAKAIDQKIFDLYGLTQEERDMIGYIDYHDTGEPDTNEE